MKKVPSVLMSMLLLAGCSKADKQPTVTNATTATQAPAASQRPAAPISPTPPPAPKPLIEPRGPINPKSVEAAGQVVQHYGALIEQGRWSEAANLWSSADAAAKLEGQLRGNGGVHLEIGDLGEPEGAAGSIYVTMPVAFTFTGARGGPVRKKAEIILRRVNDVPGSTEAQRRWHIERIDWKPAG
jgi:hypothetical protein